MADTLLLMVAMVAVIFSQPSMPDQQESATRATAQGQYIWSYVGCSNTLDTLGGYHATFGSRHLFWPLTHTMPGHGDQQYEYGIAGGRLKYWADAANSRWQEFDRMVIQYNLGRAPAVVWFQVCVDRQDVTDGSTTYTTLLAAIGHLRARTPIAQIYLSPLSPYSPESLCQRVSSVLPTVVQWIDQAVADGLALRGPGLRTTFLYPLGPMTPDYVWTDGCHPTGPRHGDPMEGSGALLLGTQMSHYFDYNLGK